MHCTDWDLVNESNVLVVWEPAWYSEILTIPTCAFHNRHQTSPSCLLLCGRCCISEAQIKSTLVWLHVQVSKWLIEWVEIHSCARSSSWHYSRSSIYWKLYSHFKWFISLFRTDEAAFEHNHSIWRPVRFFTNAIVSSYPAIKWKYPFVIPTPNMSAIWMLTEHIVLAMLLVFVGLGQRMVSSQIEEWIV